MHYYDIHGIVTVCSCVPLSELEYFRSSKTFAETDMTIDIATSILKYPSQKRKITTEKNDDSITIKYSEHLGLLGAQFAITFAPQNVKIKVNKIISKSKHVLYVNLVEPILRFIFLSKGYVLLHSACIVNQEGKGLLLSAPPDTGKTTTVLKCIKQGFSFLSDDMTIIKCPKTALSFPKPMTISSHTYKTATSVSSANDVNKKDKRWMKLRSLIHSKEGRQFVRKLGTHNVPIFTINTVGQMMVRPPKYKIENLLQKVNIMNEASIESLYFIEKEGNETTDISTNEALKKAIENSDDAFIFPPYKDILEYFRIGGKSSAELLELEKEMLEEFFSNINVKVMKSSDRTWFEQLIKTQIQIQNYIDNR